MAVIGTFGSFTTARLGIYASQASLQVTGNNIANINTRGYTRQRADLISLNSTGISKYANPYSLDIGYGVLVRSVTQLRDPFLDIRFRNQNTQTGEINATLAGLNKLAQTLDEVNKGDINTKNGVIEDALQNLQTVLEDLSVTVGSEEQDGLVREAAKSLTSFFNTAADKLQSDWELQKEELYTKVKDVNKCLTNIRDLNEQIRKQGIYGDGALELRDHRNLYIDELSEYLGIDVEYSMEKIDQFTEVEKLTIYLKDSQDPRGEKGQKIKLVDGLYAAQLLFSTEEVNPKYNAAEPQTPMLNPDYDPTALDGDASFKYLKENGDVTNDINEADMVRLNPDFTKYPLARNPLYDPDASDAPANLQYIDDNGNPTNDVTKAARVRMNPAYEKSVPLPNPNYPNPDADSPYLTVDGMPTDDVEEAARVLENPEYDPTVTDTNDPRHYRYLDADGERIIVENLSDYVPINTVKKYLDANEKPTDDFDEAKVGRYLDKDGNETTDITIAAKASRKYLKPGATEPFEPSETTNDPTLADTVDPDKFLLELTRLEDKFGRPMDKGLYGDVKKESVTIPLNDTVLTGVIQGMRELLTEEGEFASKTDVGIPEGSLDYSDMRAMDDRGNIKKGIPYYQKRLDLLAQKLAQTFNDANQLPLSDVYQTNDDGFFVDKFSAPISAPIKDAKGKDISVDDVTVEVEVTVLDENGNETVEKKRIPLDTVEGRAALAKAGKTQDEINEMATHAAECMEILRNQGVVNKGYEYYDGGVLFSNSGNSNSTVGINALNISIANGWSSRVVRVLNTTNPFEVDANGKYIYHTSDNTNIMHMISLFEAQLNYSATEIEPDAAGGDQIFFHGSFQEMYTDLGATLGMEGNIANAIATNYELMTLDLDNDRSSVSGVDLNEEATSMMQFQKSYQAACRLLTTIDSMLDTLINNTIR